MQTRLGIEAALENVRVVDLAAPEGAYCGKLLADLGADVIKVEPLEGDEGRRRGPFKDDRPDMESSLFFAFYNTNKRSLAADLSGPRSAEIARRLARWADVVVETADRELTGLSPTWSEAVRALNPRLVVASLSAYGAGGPWSEAPGTSRSVFAASGIMKTIGPPQGPPVGPPGQMAFDLAAADASSAVVCALLAREVTGVGQRVSVAALEVMAAQVNPRPLEQFVARRYERVYNPSLAPGGTYACVDGSVELTIILPSHWEGLKRLIGNPPELEGPEWDERRYREGRAEYLGEVVARAFAPWRKAELVAEAQRLRVPCGPVNTVADFAADAQVAARGFFVESERVGLGRHRLAGAPYQFSEGAWSLRRPAPRLGEHSRDILLHDLGYSAAEIEELRSESLVFVEADRAEAPT